MTPATSMALLVDPNARPSPRWEKKSMWVRKKKLGKRMCGRKDKYCVLEEGKEVVSGAITVFVFLRVRICSAPTKTCQDLVPLNTPTFKCGNECLYIPLAHACDGVCPEFYADNLNGACEEAACSLRTPNMFVEGYDVIKNDIY
jgi:hypothetical protein